MTSQSLKMGNYDILGTIGSGSFATVSEARDSRTGQMVALKVLSPNLPDDAVVAWLEKTHAIAGLGHENILPVLDSGLNGRRWIATPMAAGSVKDRLLRPWAPSSVARVLGQVGLALDAAHAQGTVHGDLKPSNVLCLGGKDTDSEDTTYFLSDFGMAELAEHGDSVARLGTNTPMAAYMSPEQATGLTITPRSDIFSLGILAYHLLTTYPPYPGNLPVIVSTKQQKGPPADPAEENPAVTPALRDVLFKALATNPLNRYSSCAAFASAFQAVIGLAQSVTEVLIAPAAGSLSGTAMGLCWNCGHRNALNDARCIECGTALVVPENFSTEDHYVPEPLPSPRRDLIRSVMAFGAALMTTLLFSVALTELQLPDRPTSNLTAASLPGEWATFQADPMHHGYILGNFDFEDKLLWSFRMEGPFMAPPVASEDTVYLATGDRRVLALRKSDGSVKWTFPVNGPVNSAPALTENSLYVGLRDGTVFALDRANGQVRWKVDTGDPIYYGITIKNGIAFVPNGAGLLAFDALTGKELWVFSPEGRVVSSPSVTHDDKVVFGSRDGRVHVLDAQTGEALLKYRSGLFLDSTGAIAGNTAVFGLPNGSLLGLDISQRNRFGDHKLFDFKVQLFLWQMWSKFPRQRGFSWVTKPGSGTASSPAIANGTAYYLSLPAVLREGPATLFAVKMADQKILWTASVDARHPPGQRKPQDPIIVGDTVLVASYDGRILGFDAKTGALSWSFHSPPELIPSTSPVVGGDILLAGVSSVRFPQLDIERLDPSGRPLPDQFPGRVGNWYYRYPDSPCVGDADAWYGPYETEKETRGYAETDVPPCSFLYALQ